MFEFSIASPARRLALACSLAFFSIPAATAQDAGTPPGLPIVKIFATGGTIANTPDGRIAVQAIIDELPEVEDIAELRVEDVTRVASSNLTWQEFIDTARAIERSLAEEPEIDGVVVTIGSNTSEEMAYFLNLVLDTDKPVVVTAAQRQRTTRSEDSSRNFIDALITAATPEAGGKGALLVANELIHSGREVTKNVVSRVDTWESLDTGALGIVSGGEAIFYRTPTRRHTAGSEFRLEGIETAADLPRVDILHTYVGVTADPIESAVEAGADGLVIASFATATPHRGTQVPALEAAAEQGVAVVIANRGSSGRVSARPAPFVGADNLSPQKAHLLLMLALTVTDDPAEIQRIFDQY